LSINPYQSTNTPLEDSPTRPSRFRRFVVVGLSSFAGTFLLIACAFALFQVGGWEPYAGILLVAFLPAMTCAAISSIFMFVPTRWSAIGGLVITLTVTLGVAYYTGGK
jgi:hypothetical protein